MLTQFPLERVERQKVVTKLCVSGYIRLHSSNDNMSKDLIGLCISMHFEIKDEWNIKLFNKFIQFNTTYPTSNAVFNTVSNQIIPEYRSHYSYI